MQLAPPRSVCAPAPPLPLPLPALPLRFAPTPTRENLLLEAMEAGFPPGPALPPPRIAKICRNALPAMLGNFFPHPDTPLANPIATYRALLFALRTSSDALPADPALRPFLDAFCHTLEQAGVFVVWLASAPPTQDGAFCDSWLLPQLRAGEPVLLEGGYDAPGGGHAVGVYLWPTAAEEVLLAVADRMPQERHHCEDRPRHPQPVMYRFKTSALTSAAGRAFFCALMALQRPDESHDLEQFYAVIDAVARDCGGVLEVGIDATGAVHQNLRIAGQAALKANTCTLSSALAVLHFALHAAFGTLDPTADSARRDAVHALYKQLKSHCRGAVLQQFLGALRQVRRAGDADTCMAYEAALTRTRDYLTERATDRDMAGHLAALKTV